MNKVVMIVAALVALAFVGCASTPTAAEMMAAAKGKAPDGVLIAQVTGSSAVNAAKEAKNAYIKAIMFMMRNMVQDAVAAGEIPGSATTSMVVPMTSALGNSGFGNVAKVESGVGKGDTYWHVSYLEKSDAVREINAALAAVKESTPDMANFKIDSRIDAEYTKAANREWKN